MAPFACLLVAADVACLVTLGTPHRFRPGIPWRHPGVVASEHLASVAPVSRLAPATAHLTVGFSQAVAKFWEAYQPNFYSGAGMEKAFELA